MKLPFTLLFAIAIIPCFSQFASQDTLYNKYIVSSGAVSEFTTYEQVAGKNYSVKFFYTGDSLIEGDYFISFGVCVSERHEPFYFIRTTFLPIIDNSFYEYNKSIQMTLKIQDRENVFSAQKEVNLVSGGKETQWASVKYLGLNLKKQLLYLCHKYY